MTRRALLDLARWLYAAHTTGGPFLTLALLAVAAGAALQMFTIGGPR